MISSHATKSSRDTQQVDPRNEFSNKIRNRKANMRQENGRGREWKDENAQEESEEETRKRSRTRRAMKRKQ